MGTRLFNVSVQVRSGVITNFIAQELNNGQSRLETQNTTFRMWLLYRMFSISPAPDSDQCTFHRRTHSHIMSNTRGMRSHYRVRCAQQAPQICWQHPIVANVRSPAQTTRLCQMIRSPSDRSYVSRNTTHFFVGHTSTCVCVCVWYACTHFAHPHRQSSIDDDDNGGTARSMRAHV